MLGKVCSEKRVVVCGYILNVDLWQDLLRVKRRFARSNEDVVGELCMWSIRILRSCIEAGWIPGV